MKTLYIMSLPIESASPDALSFNEVLLRYQDEKEAISENPFDARRPLKLAADLETPELQSRLAQDYFTAVVAKTTEYSIYQDAAAVLQANIVAATITPADDHAQHAGIAENVHNLLKTLALSSEPSSCYRIDENFGDTDFSEFYANHRDIAPDDRKGLNRKFASTLTHDVIALNQRWEADGIEFSRIDEAVTNRIDIYRFKHKFRMGL